MTCYGAVTGNREAAEKRGNGGVRLVPGSGGQRITGSRAGKGTDKTTAVSPAPDSPHAGHSAIFLTPPPAVQRPLTLCCAAPPRARQPLRSLEARALAAPSVCSLSSWLSAWLPPLITGPHVAAEHLKR